MVQILKGETVTLIVKEQTGLDDADRPIYTETEVQVENVLIGQPTTDELTTEMNLSGRRIAYVLGIPKGDTHDWENTTVRFWGKTYRTIGSPMRGVEANIPLSWGMNVKVESYEQ